MADEVKVRKTKELLVFDNAVQPELVIKINPNDGLDLGIIEITRTINIVVHETSQDNRTITVTFEKGSIVIENECKFGTLKLSSKLWKKIGKIGKAILAIRDNNCYIIPK